MWKVKEGLADLVPLNANQTTCMVYVSGRTELAGLHQQALVPWQDRQVIPSLASKEVPKKLT
jgi:hypothetical protein